MSENVHKPAEGLDTEADSLTEAEALEKSQQFIVPVSIIAEVYHEIGNALSVLLPATRLSKKHFEQIRKVLTEFRGIDPELPLPKLREEIIRCRKAAARGRGIDHTLKKITNSFKSCLKELELIKLATEKLRQARTSGDVVPAPVEVCGEVEQIIDFFSDHLKSERGIQISFVNGAPGGLWVACSPDELSYIMKNLVHNAIDAINERESLGLYSAGEERSIRIEVVRQDGFARIRCHDNGAGMTEDVKRKIFNPFFTTKPRVKGTGIGLSIVRDIVRRRGGKMDVTSKRNEGTEFILDLPLWRGEAANEQ